MSNQDDKTARIVAFTTAFNVLIQGAEIEVHRECLLSLAKTQQQPTIITEREIWSRTYQIAKTRVDRIFSSDVEVAAIYQRLLEQWKQAHGI